jgi:hypothetical protein
VGEGEIVEAQEIYRKQKREEERHSSTGNNTESDVIEGKEKGLLQVQRVFFTSRKKNKEKKKKKYSWTVFLCQIETCPHTVFRILVNYCEFAY